MIKWVTKPPIKKEKKEKKRAREKDRNRFAKNKNKKVQKSCFDYVRLVGKHAFFLAKLIFSHSYAN